MLRNPQNDRFQILNRLHVDTITNRMVLLIAPHQRLSKWQRCMSETSLMPSIAYFACGSAHHGRNTEAEIREIVEASAWVCQARLLAFIAREAGSLTDDEDGHYFSTSYRTAPCRSNRVLHALKGFVLALECYCWQASSALP